MPDVVAVGAPAEGSEATSATPEPPRQQGWRGLLAATAPALVYLGIRQAGVLILALMAGENNTTTRKSLTAWDGQWYLGIASGGYRNAPPWLFDANGDRTAHTPLAFFPGYPKSVGWLAELPFVTLGGAAFTVTLLSGVLAAYGLARIGTLIRGGSRRTGLILVALFAASPMGVVLSMTYSEAMFCAAAAWALVFVLRRNWLAAGACCALAGLVRPTGLALVVTVGLAALVYVLRDREAGEREKLSALLACVLAPAGLVGYLWWSGAQIRQGQGFFAQLGGWSELQKVGWGSWFDGGAATVRYTGQALARSESVHDIVTIAALVIAVVLVAICLATRVEWPLVVYGLGVLVMVIGSNGLMNSKARLLLPAFVLLIPIAIGLAKRKPVTIVVVLCAVTVVSGWFGAHALVAWRYAI